MIKRIKELRLASKLLAKYTAKYGIDKELSKIIMKSIINSFILMIVSSVVCIGLRYRVSSIWEDVLYIITGISMIKLLLDVMWSDKLYCRLYELKYGKIIDKGKDHE